MKGAPVHERLAEAGSCARPLAAALVMLALALAGSACGVRSEASTPPRNVLSPPNAKAPATTNAAPAESNTPPSTVPTVAGNPVAQMPRGAVKAVGGHCGAIRVTQTDGFARRSGGVQRIDVRTVEAYFDPNNVIADAGAPTELTFLGRSSCVSRITFTTLGIRAELSERRKVVRLPALKPGSYPFSCQMAMAWGRVLVK